MAEVLITLGIIGVVAALTIPTVIAQHQKQQTVVQLKKAYTTLAQALQAAQAEYGDPSSWSSLPQGNLDKSDEDQALLASSAKEDFVYNYLMPYMKVLKDCGVNNDKKCMKQYHKTAYDRKSNASHMLTGLAFVGVDGVVYAISQNSTEKTDEEGNKTSITSGQYLIHVDINGSKGPNVMGKDIFLMEFNSSGKLKMNGAGLSRDTLNNNNTWGCKSKTGLRHYCGALIQRDGWQIKDDYLW